MARNTSGRDFEARILSYIKHALNLKVNVSDIPTAVSELTNDSGYQTAAQVQTAIAAAAELPAVTASDNGKFVRVVNGAYAVQTVPAAESNSF